MTRTSCATGREPPSKCTRMQSIKGAASNSMGIKRVSFPVLAMFRFNFALAMVVLLLMLAVLSNGHPPATTVMPAALVNGPGGAYDDKFDNVDIDEILAQERLLNNYIKCLENSGPCTPDAKMLKDILPDAMTTDCVKCTEKQKYGADKVTRHLIDNRPEDWLRLEKIYDPQATYRMKYEESKTANGKNEKIELSSLDQAQGDS